VYFVTLNSIVSILIPPPPPHLLQLLPTLPTRMLLLLLLLLLLLRRRPIQMLLRAQVRVLLLVRSICGPLS
jgi:hypothetical protein